MKIKYFVRTIKTRDFDYSPLEYEELVDYNPDYIQSFIDQLRIISDYDAVLLEDDLKLCKDFQSEIEKAIEQYPDMIINFFENYDLYYETHEQIPFAYNQCTYYPKGVAKILADEMQKLKDKTPKKYSQYDHVEVDAMMNLNISHIAYRPCLVQHLGGNVSIIGNKGKRCTPYFIDYIKELGIDYKDARKHLSELVILMKGDFSK